MARNIRSGQLLSPFGIGQLVNFPGDESLMICGLDAWDKVLVDRESAAGKNNIDRRRLTIREARLERLLDVSEFRKPFPYADSNGTGINEKLMIPAVRFPGWHYCIKCHKMRRIPLQQPDKPVCGGDCRGTMLPVRFIAACPEGHIQEVPFLEWTHRGSIPNDGQIHNLSYHAGSGSGDLSGIWINCSCGASRSLAGIMGEHALARLNISSDQDNEEGNSANSFYTCRGHRPWLGREGVNRPQNCGSNLRVLIRGGSNIHYSIIRSALYLPGFSEQANPVSGAIIEQFGKNRLTDLKGQDTQGHTLRIVLENQEAVVNGKIAIDELLEDVKNYLNGIDQPDEEVNEETLRSEEYNYILAGREAENADFKALVKGFDDYEKSEFLNEYFEGVVLIERLRETRVFAGFTRINPEDNRNQQQNIADLSLNESVSWLPAHVVYGEGIFLKFRTDKIDQWIASGPIHDHAQRIISRYHSARRNRWPEYVDRSLSPAFIMMHTFTHLLINRLCFNCGYGSSSLRERIYFSSDPENRMNGILIYTSSGDSEGSMGGLVRQGREMNLAKLINESIEDAQWCSSDPVCSDVGWKTGQGPDRVNGAACHNCAIVPETSCEEFNMLLDRALVINTIQDSDTGYFKLP